MKKITILAMIISTSLLAQTPTGFPPTPLPAFSLTEVSNAANSSWYRGGNTTAYNTNNIFGTMWNSPVYHYTNGKQRMTVWDDSYSGPTWGTPFGGGVTINYDPANPIVQPLSLLTIGDNIGVGGWRNWMSVGTFNNFGSDNMYIGLKSEGSIDRQDAVINWGDNTTAGGAIYGPDYLRFIFTAPQFAGYPGFGASADGLETMRINHLGRIGVGNYYNSLVEAPFSKDPARRFEILSDKPTAVANGNPTFRITHTQQNPAALLTTGKYSEFEDRSTGDLFINTRNNALVTNVNRDFKQRYIGINTNTPGNTMELNSQFTSALTLNGFGGTGWAGLRFTDLKSTSVAQLNPSLNVLSVDANGDVILVPGGTTGLGNICGATSNSLTNSYEIPMAGFNFNYTMPALSTSQVHIGQTACAINPARLHVVNDNLTTAGGFNSKANNLLVLYGSYSKSENTGLGDATGVFGEAVCVNPANNTAIGVHGVATSTASRVNIGIYGKGKDGFAQTYGGYFQALGSTSFGNSGIYAIASTVNPSATTYGVSALVNGFGNANYGGYFSAAGTGLNTGIYADCTTSPTNWAGFFNEKVFINGAGISSAGLIFSDQNIKINVATVSNPLDLLLRLRPVSYNLNNAYAPQLNVDTAKTFGLIAQEVAVVIPELVKDVIVPPIYDSIGTVITPSVAIKSLNYNGLIPLTISAIQAINSSQNVMQTQLNKAGLSDALVKTNINNFNALAKIKILNPVSYNFTNVSVPQLTFTPQVDYGFVAQQLQLVYPELVDTLRIPAKYDSLGVIVNIAKVLKTVNYKAMSALLTRAVQEQQFKIDSLLLVASKQDSINNAVQTQIANLTSMINACCSNPGAKISNPSINQLDVELSDKDAIVLNQNVPNPFAEQTTITYNVPASVTKAQLLFFNANGQVIQTVDIKTRGKGKVNVFASDLSSGLYHYTLVADGKVIDSKKMVRE